MRKSSTGKRQEVNKSVMFKNRLEIYRIALCLQCPYKFITLVVILILAVDCCMTHQQHYKSGNYNHNYNQLWQSKFKNWNTHSVRRRNEEKEAEQT